MLSSLNEEQLQSNTTQNLDPLTILSPSTHSLGYLYFITARCCIATSENAQQLFELLYHFITVFDAAQVLRAPARSKFVFYVMVPMNPTISGPLLVVEPVAKFIQRLTPSLNILTPLHSYFAKACVINRMYKYSHCIIDQAIEQINATAYHVTILDYLEYHYNASLLYIGSKQYERALELLSLVISAPATVPSAIQLEAYKKYILLSLIQDGKIRPLPKYTASIIEKTMELQHFHYFSLAKAFENNQLDEFDQLLQWCHLAMKDDQNLGLAKQCTRALQFRKINTFTKVYKRVGIQDMALKLDPKGTTSALEVEHMLVSMVGLSLSLLLLKRKT
ncbi:hypothetical protein BDF14DRAFT_1732666 [Spinellus fusiger]|nr:hypothetical protein BDF14DRAFT_1732666 [Spinellus fusiger]